MDFNFVNIINNEILITPDFGGSDLWHHYIPLKYFLQQSLLKFHLPFWSFNFGLGLPIFAQGQIGTFSIFNLFYFFLPFTAAFNLSYLLSLTVSFSGVFWLSRNFKFKVLPAFLTASLFTFSGWLICQTNHTDIFQASAWLPWIFGSFWKATDGKNPSYFFLTTLFLAQQIFTNALQVVFITLCLLFSYLTYKFIHNKKVFLKIFIIFTFVVILAGAASLIQLGPVLEYSLQTPRSAGLSFQEATYFPYPYKHLITFIDPFYLGNPTNGSYPKFSEDWGIFWENTAYLGTLPLILVVFSFFKNPKNRLKLFFALMVLFSLALSFGKYSPIQFFFAFPPFNFFRVPSRFLILTTFSLAFLAGWGLNVLIKISVKINKLKAVAQFFSVAIVIYCLYNLFHFAAGYLPFDSSEKLLSPPETLGLLRDNNSRIYTIGSAQTWNEEFLKNGWQNKKKFLFFRNYLDGNFNLIFDIDQLSDHNSIPLTKTDFFNQTIQESVSINEVDKTASFSAEIPSLLKLSSVNYLISPYKIIFQKPDDWELLSLESTKEEYINIYKRKLPVSKYYFVCKTKIIKSYLDFIKYLKDPLFDPLATAMLYSNLNLNNCLEGSNKISLIQEENNKIKLKTETQTPALLIISDYNYPGWQAKIDNKKTDIINVNFWQKGIFTPRGEHLIELDFLPVNFFLFAIISIVIHLVCIFLFLLLV